MSRLTLSIVIPVYNEAGHIGGTLDALRDGIAASTWFEGEIIAVDDGSTDETLAVLASRTGSSSVRIITQANSGRLAARRAGLAAATGEFVLFLDSRVTLGRSSLQFVGERIKNGEQVWNAHVHIARDGNPFGHFWNALTELAWSAYFANPRTTSFTVDDFDAYPKGTTGFLAPTDLMRQAFARFRTRYRDERNASDDTPIIRWIAGQVPIHISPEFSCTYSPRTSLRGFLRHAYHRGIVFLDGHGRPDSRFFPAVLAFYPLSLLGLIAILKRPVLVGAMGAATIGLTAAVAGARQRPLEEATWFALLSPLYAVAHGAGMWRGLALLLENRLSSRAHPAA